jgi:hypothetical protein
MTQVKSKSKVWDLPFLLVRGRHHLVDAGDENIAFRIDELAHESDEIGHGLINHTAKYARMEISSRTGNDNLVV